MWVKQQFWHCAKCFGACPKRRKTVCSGASSNQESAAPLSLAVNLTAAPVPAQVHQQVNGQCHPGSLKAWLHIMFFTEAANLMNVNHFTFPWSGVQVCREAFCKLMGISSCRLVRTRHCFQGEDQRKYSNSFAIHKWVHCKMSSTCAGWYLHVLVSFVVKN